MALLAAACPFAGLIEQRTGGAKMVVVVEG